MPTSDTKKSLRIVLFWALHTAARILVAVLGGYAVVALLVAVTAAILPRLGMLRSEAVALAVMLGFVAYLLLLLWAFSVRGLLRLCLSLAAAAGVLALLSHWLG